MLSVSRPVAYRTWLDPPRNIQWASGRQVAVRTGAGEVWRVQVILADDPHQREQGVAPGIGQRRPHAAGAAVSDSGHTGQCEGIHSPEVCRRTVVRLTMALARSMSVV